MVALKGWQLLLLLLHQYKYRSRGSEEMQVVQLSQAKVGEMAG